MEEIMGDAADIVHVLCLLKSRSKNRHQIQIRVVYFLEEVEQHILALCVIIVITPVITHGIFQNQITGKIVAVVVEPKFLCLAHS